MIQKAYDIEKSTKGIIKRINKIGKAKATVLSDKNVKKMQEEYNIEREKARKQLEKDVYKRKKGINKHSAYWSAM